MSSRLALVGVRAGYGPVEAVHGVDLTFPAGAIVAIVGHNGAGKSTVLRCLAGIVRPRTGRVLWDGVDITRWSTFERARAGMALVPDEHGVFATLTVEENLALFGRPRPMPEVIEVAFEAFPELERLVDHRAGTLSGGERQMLALARVLVRPGSVVLLDEVSRGLSAGVTARFYDRLRQLVGPDRIVVLSEQFLDVALAAADLVYVMARGRVIFAGESVEAASGQGLYETLGSS